jgi:hypothetical protein
VFLDAKKDAFHKHLDTCERCKCNPFALCPMGSKLLVESAKEDIRVARIVAVYPRKHGGAQ